MRHRPLAAARDAYCASAASLRLFDGLPLEPTPDDLDHMRIAAEHVLEAALLVLSAIGREVSASTHQNVDWAGMSAAVREIVSDDLLHPINLAERDASEPRLYAAE